MDGNRITAKPENGVMKLEIPKRRGEDTSRRQIQID
ncbi:Hsp20 family protein [Paenibacillus sp. JX-17]|uniref:Hsp20 family protein n=1 Tax=Paenibacillus lacisoli TaxID=3064525 RepID=A0ABT9CET5_9BACL|nr:Hsp20 family protein [Paenibacillus sp. JX-17]MDO7907762.1 Hsp20 family protein [Paenibacillus sp. JX-17]